MCEYTFWDKFLVNDHRALKAMEDFPLHKFRSNPVAYVPMGGGTRGGLVAAIYRDGNIAALKPALHNVIEIDAKENEDTQEQFLAAGVAMHDGELAVAIWDSASQSYTVNLYRVEKYSFKRVGSAPLAPPRTGEVLCGFAHTGDRLMCVWVDGSLQIYGPKEPGLALLQSYKLAGFDFGVMRKQSGTEDLKSLPVGVSVCGSIGIRDLVVTVGPNAEKKGLKYVVVNTRTGMVQSNGVLYEKVTVEAPVKLIVEDALAGRIRGVVGGQDMGEEFVAARSTTLAGRLGMNATKPFSRKRKHKDDILGVSPVKHIKPDPQWDLVPEKPSGSHRRSVTFTLPAWAKLICEGQRMLDGGILASTPMVKKMAILDSPPKKNGMLKEAMLSKSVADLMDSFASKNEPSLVDKAIHVLKECKGNETILTVDLVGVTAGAIAELGDCWDKLEALIEVHPLRKLTNCPNLVAELVKSSKLSLLELVVKGVDSLESEELKTALHAIFDSESNPEQIVCQIDHYDRMRSSAQASVSRAEGKNCAQLAELLPEVQRLVALVDGFSQTEVLIHPILCKDTDAVDLAEAFCDLLPAEAGKLLGYLGKWLEKHLKLVPTKSGAPGGGLPRRKVVAEWLNALVGCQLAALSRREQNQEVANRLMNTAFKWKSFIQDCMACKSSLECLVQQQDLTVASSKREVYKISLLDLTVDSEEE